ncbi:hypothetical protein BJ917_0372 [Pseudomonas sp. WPR_5_2]|nr:hypothetical protein BJ917_0372 [Pseudomonas sp. WPR_5_2]
MVVRLNSEVTMYSQHTTTHLMACRRLAMEQNEKLFEAANTLNRSAIDLLDRPDLDSEMFLHYLQLRGKAEALFREALDHLSLINEQFPIPQKRSPVWSRSHSPHQPSRGDLIGLRPARRLWHLLPCPG